MKQGWLVRFVEEYDVRLVDLGGSVVSSKFVAGFNTNYIPLKPCILGSRGGFTRIFPSPRHLCYILSNFE